MEGGLLEDLADEALEGEAVLVGEFEIVGGAGGAGDRLPELGAFGDDFESAEEVVGGEGGKGGLLGGAPGGLGGSPDLHAGALGGEDESDVEGVGEGGLSGGVAEGVLEAAIGFLESLEPAFDVLFFPGLEPGLWRRGELGDAFHERGEGEVAEARLAGDGMPELDGIGREGGPGVEGEVGGVPGDAVGSFG